MPNASGWFFCLPSKEIAVNPTDGEPQQEILLMCDELSLAAWQVTAKGAEAEGEVTAVSRGSRASIRLLIGSIIPLCQPCRPVAQ